MAAPDDRPHRAAAHRRRARAAGILLAAALAATVAAEEARPKGEGGSGVFSAIGAELKTWGSDSIALVTAPVSWDGTDWERFGLFSAGVGGLMLADESIYHWCEEHRSQTDADLADGLAPLGQQYALGLSIGLLAGGLVFKAPHTRDLGREALEASILSGVLVNFVLKPAFGRERPWISDGETEFSPFTPDGSFPSGHAAEAFAVASVIAMRSDGWVVPTIAYTTASLVSVSRVVNSHHFASDVLAGAVLGAAVGRFVVQRHAPRPERPPPGVRVTLLAIPHGVAVHVSW